MKLDLFRALDKERVLYASHGLVVVDKPVGVACQAEGEAQDDLPSRLKSALGLSYLGVHQRLDRETSGVIAYASERARNAPLAEALQAGSKSYVAGVVGWKGRDRNLFDYLAPHEGGSVISSKGDSRAKQAVTHVALRERRGERALLDVTIETGRTHQIRVQLANVSAAIAGDRRYGNVPASRMMLHAHSLVLESKEFVAPLPRSFTLWLQGADAAALDDDESVAEALQNAAQARCGLAMDTATTAFRLVNGEGDGLPGVVVDVYGEHAVVHLYGDAALHAERVILDAVADLGFLGVYLKRRPRQANDVVDARGTELAPSEPQRGRPAPDEFGVLENGVQFGVRLGDGLSTGLFLDQRDARRRVREAAKGKRVLNLFSYTCGFGLNAALGGASDLVEVDASGAALDRGESNHALNGTQSKRLRADCFDFLARAARQGRQYDVILCDPPTYASTKKRRWKSGTQWRELAKACFDVAAPGALVLLSSNDSRMAQAKFRRYVREAEVKLASLRDLRPPADYPVVAGVDPIPRRLWATLP